MRKEVTYVKLPCSLVGCPDPVVLTEGRYRAKRNMGQTNFYSSKLCSNTASFNKRPKPQT